jgi:hypothetical protein
MLRHFKGTGPGVIMLILLTAVLLWAGSFKFPSDYIGQVNYNPGVLFDWFGALVTPFPVLALLLGFMLMLAVSILLISFNTGSFFLNERTFLPGVIFIIITALFPEYQTLHPVIPASLLLLLAVIRIAGSHRESGIAYHFFDAGLMIGAGSLVYPNLIWFGVLLIAGILLLRTINIHEIAISLLGLLTPYFLVYGIYYVAGNDLSELTIGFRSKLFTESPDQDWPRTLIITAFFILISIVISVSYLTTVFSKKKVKSRKIFSLLIWVGVITILIYFFSPSASVELVYILAIPASYILAHYYIGIRRKKIVPELLFTGTLLLVLVIHLLDFLRVAI